MKHPIRVVVADDSPFICQLLTQYIESEDDMKVVGTAFNGREAVDLVLAEKPDVVTLDLEMPEMNGLTALDQIMHKQPSPVVVISGLGKMAADATLKALEIGAVDFILKFTPGHHVPPELLRREIVGKVRAASRVRVVRNLKVGGTVPNARASLLGPHPLVKNAIQETPGLVPGGVVVIGASTGGPVALRQLLSSLPGDFNACVLIIQHIPADFTNVLASQLMQYTNLPAKEATDGDALMPGLILVAPGGRHMLVDKHSRIRLNDGPEIKGHRPSVSVTMQSAAQVYGDRTSGVVMTGMGDDGTLGLLAIRTKHGKTYAQTPESCVVDGMPRTAIERGVVDHVAPPFELARLLTRHQHRVASPVNL